ncbi:Sulfate-transporting ATPase [Tepidanaerobacter acetatoxydans Re1]|uniref:Sulfate-transporting ATPase n=1 Tax=Tepidanaerobacter acetatoxydans (strain DSM 21804 / JCM 16047 / Re1) TaxID=1209989 RepID=F4LXH1_TEPAE|nr:ABC transporter ATP-binding protein [Tepidanaerobacter acetatoxydans]AEE91073.1 Sulfate-transporting ATPase [Tepidanaerobacter acetatoxydans Re1]CCP25701.1 Sulfate-transporting ATPase [Tepidanaerobacter acetatoxydans Re1]
MVIQTLELTKKYNRKVTALNHVSLSIDTGVFGLLGKNGSGKTTLMRILTTLLTPTDGKVSILGMDAVKANQEEIKRNIGYLPQEFGFYKDFTVYEIMQYMCFLRGTEKAMQKALIHDALEQVNLLDHSKKKYKQLSGGMKRRVGLAQAIMHSPPILIVDEPTAGVDPEERINIRKLLSTYAENHAVLFSTHIVEDIEYTCNKLAVLDGGNLLFTGALDELLHLADGKIYECAFDSLAEFQEFEQKYKVISFKRDGSKTKAIAIVESAKLTNATPYRPSLEEAYVYITTRRE